MLTDLDEIRERTEALIREKCPVAIDTESGYHGESREGVSLHAEENFIVSVQFTNSPDWSRLIPLGFDSGPNVDNRAVAPLLWALFHAVDDEGLPLAVAHGAIAELRWLARWFLRYLWDHPLYGRQVIAARGYYPVRSCTMLESFAEGKNLHHGLKFITALPPGKGGFGYQMRELKDGADSLLGRLLGRAPTRQEGNSVRFNVFDPQDPAVVSYACEDTVYALLHHLRRWPQVRNSRIYKLEMAVLPVVCDMADTGVAYDWNLLREAAARARDFADLLLAEVVGDFEALAGEKLPPTFNFGSSQQLTDLFYAKCALPVYHWTDGGKAKVPKPSIDAKKALPRLIAEVPAVAKYHAWKRLNTLLDNFLDIYENKYSWSADGRAHPTLMQHGTIGGRFACENPNVQQQPGTYHVELRDGTTFDFNFRNAVIALPPGQREWHELVLTDAGWVPSDEPDGHEWYILGFDLSQQELRVLAAEAGETALLEAFERGEDVHKLTASRMLGIALEDVTSEQRQDLGKRMNFAIGYGQTEWGMAEVTGMPVEECRAKFAAYHAAYPRLKQYTRRVQARARREGFVITKFGRRVTLHDIRSDNPKVRSAEERTAANSTIQGPATGDYVKMAMVRAVRSLKAAGLTDRVRMFLNVHDALEFYVRRDVAPATVIAVLQPAVIFPVNGPGVAWPPLVADWHVGESWGQKKEVHTEDGRVVLGKEEKCPRCRKPAVAVPPPPSPAAVSPAALAPLPPSGPAREVIVRACAEPSRDQVRDLGLFLKTLPGQNAVELVLPGEKRFPVSFRCGLAPEHEARVSVILGSSATVRYAAGSVDAAALTSSLGL
jgi:DNA polymerase I-like protein with 3'-5' exonuclease and polymerase domains